MDRAPLSARVEASPLGRLAIRAVIVVLLFTMVVGNLPPSSIKDRVQPPLGPLMAGLGVEQNWGVFSPDPRSVNLFLHAEIDYARGATQIWRPPTSARILNAQRAARWTKYVEYARADDRRDQLWRPLAVWIAKSHTSSDRQPTRVRLVRSFQQLNPPGERETQPVQSFTYFELDLRTGRAEFPTEGR